MFNILKRKKSPEPSTPSTTEKTGFFSRLKSGLTKTRSHLVEGISNIFLGKKKLDKEVLELIETQLLSASY